ncbi:fanconi anemia group M protein homolog [Caerostris extrusa]|uniref:Fanconi anemia group M protein homolog n=1 Tax=Caerostris extrusa TaxID=172846 RepID=A0AAV4MZ33_CAEEX|nr:fanconi anemia group M protein homolog [Caerostris extrusa]
MSKKQKTLFESWNKCSSKATASSSKQNSTDISAYASPSHSVFQPNVYTKATNQLGHNGFDYDAGKTWIYPHQLSCSWYPNGKIIFMAPTKPLVAQQIDACYKITGISPCDTTQMTGTNVPEERKRMWMKKRAVKLVMSNLLISHVELRTEDSDDVRPYTHVKNIEKIVVPLGEKLLAIKSKFLDVSHVLV